MSSAHNSISARAQEHTCTLDRRHSQHTMPHSSTPQRNWALHLTGHVNSGFYSKAALLKQSKHRLAHTATNTTLYTTSRCAHHHHWRAQNQSGNATVDCLDACVCFLMQTKESSQANGVAVELDVRCLHNATWDDSSGGSQLKPRSSNKHSCR